MFVSGESYFSVQRILPGECINLRDSPNNIALWFALFLKNLTTMKLQLLSSTGQLYIAYIFIHSLIHKQCSNSFKDRKDMF